MGRLDFSIVDKRLAKVEDKQMFGGRVEQLNFKLQILNKFKIPHTVHSEGSIVVVSANGFNYRYNINESDSGYAVDILQCCKAVKSDVRKFTKENGPLSSSKAVSLFTNQGFTTSFIVSGNKEVSLVDIKHCYWKILSNFKIISEKTYLKFKDNRDARLVAVGCLQRTKKVEQNNGTEVVKKEIKQGVYSWVWRFVQYKAYKAIDTVCNAIQWRIFSYVTDGIYLPTESVNKAVDILKQIGFDVSIRNFKIVGYCNHYIVLEDLQTGSWKRANLGISSAIKEALRHISVLELNKKIDGVEDVELKTKVY